ncbi:hypothetical protein M422DRAFT_60904 [Sphaerobolus stellatus SS14]|uniref:Major facilitator superfamily (MFS) profile domain-containing protein n=1 Tax=Sphaerobolus stellatus (strain SS14) TaxID=990650 RepID=A0A0C9VK58_SPHS4|nr:hypothetical protein M422DRAFT_60904 [Sphaerobolus stellatus SS14]
MELPAGGLLDKGYFRPTVLVRSILYNQLFLSQGVGMGISAGLFYLPSLAVQAHHWNKRRSSVGGIVYPILLNNVFHGFAWVVRASGFLTLGAVIAANLLMSAKPNFRSRRGEVAKPNIREIYTDVPFVLIAVAGIHFGRTIPNFFADKYGPINLIILMVIGTAVIICSMFGVHTVGGVAAFAILFRFFSVISPLSPVITSFARHPNEIGIRFGIAYIGVSLPYLTGPPIAGALRSTSELLTIILGPDYSL